MLKKYVLFAAGLLLSTKIVFSAPEDYRINQLGYYTSAFKNVMIFKCTDETFQLLNAKKEVVYTGTLSAVKVWAGDSVRIANFSTFSQEGVYQLKTQSRGLSYPIAISTKNYSNLSKALLKAFYYQRCSMPLEEKYAGNFARAAGHPDMICKYHSDLKMPPGALFSSPKGWYDAGDYGKYVVNAGITVGTMLQFHEMFPEYFADNSINIPESGNSISDLLDEVKYELDWLKTMQDTSSGRVFHKLTSLDFCAFIMPADDKMERYAIGVSSPATFDFAAMLAMGARIYKSIDNAYSEDCLAKAEKAWAWGYANQDVYFSNPTNVKTGEYGDANSVDEMIWAAAELYITTGKDIYKDVLKTNNINYSLPGWPNVKALAGYSLVNTKNNLDSTLLVSVKKSILDGADWILKQIENSGYRLPAVSFNWGSNSNIANIGICLLFAYKISSDTKYVQGASEIADYLLGKNPLDYSYITGFGYKSPLNPHHRIFSADGLPEPIPGFLVGGPNGSPKSYFDNEDSYTTNETAINWNAPAMFLFASLDAILPKLPPVSVRHTIGRTANQSANIRIGKMGTIELTVNNTQTSTLKMYSMNGILVKDFSTQIQQGQRGLIKINTGLKNGSGVYIMRFFDGNQNHTVMTQVLR
jgi:endoglucanase